MSLLQIATERASVPEEIILSRSKRSIKFATLAMSRLSDRSVGGAILFNQAPGRRRSEEAIPAEMARLQRATRGMVALLFLCLSPVAFAFDLQPYLTAAASEAANKRFSQAADIYSMGLDQNPDEKARVELLLMRGITYDLAGKSDAAEADFTAVIDLIGKTDPRAYRERGIFYFARNRLELSLADYSAGAQYFSSNGIFPNGQGLVLTNQGKFPEAIARFNEAVRLDPTSPVFLLGRAEAYNRSQQSRKALDDYEKALSHGHLVPRDMVRLQVGRGYANLNLNNCPVAVEEFTAALKLSPDFANALKWRGLCLEQMGKTDSAISDYEAALTLKPSDSVLAKKLQAMRDSK